MICISGAETGKKNNRELSAGIPGEAGQVIIFPHSHLERQRKATFQRRMGTERPGKTLLN
jgi:hypothetical protein